MGMEYPARIIASGLNMINVAVPKIHAVLLRSVMVCSSHFLLACVNLMITTNGRTSSSTPLRFMAVGRSALSGFVAMCHRNDHIALLVPLFDIAVRLDDLLQRIARCQWPV